MKIRVVCLFLLGAISVAVSSVFALNATKRQPPGELVPIQREITWSGSAGPRDSASGMAEVTFRLRNTGGRPVNILSTTSGCGCATPTISPTTIAPGAEGELHVSAMTFPIGEKLVPISLETDSPITKTVDVALRIIGTRQLPFLIRVSGDLNYLEEDLASEPRTIEVTTIERKGEPTREPAVKCDLSFLKIEYLSSNDRPYVTPDSIERKHLYRVIPIAKPPTGTFAGELIAVDPWDRTHVERLPIQGEVRPTITLLPTAMVLNAGDPASSHAMLVVTTRESSPNLTVRAESGPLVVVPEGVQSARFHRFRVSLERSNAAIPRGVHRLVVKQSPDKVVGETVRVAITEGK